MPAQGLRRRFLELQRARHGAPTHGDLCRLAHFYAVSVDRLGAREIVGRIQQSAGGEQGWSEAIDLTAPLLAMR